MGILFKQLQDGVVEPDNELVHRFLDNHRDAVAEKAFKHFATKTLVKSSDALMLGDLENGCEHVPRRSDFRCLNIVRDLFGFFHFILSCTSR